MCSETDFDSMCSETDFDSMCSETDVTQEKVNF